MIYIKIDDKIYLDYENYRKILSASGCIIGSYDIHVKGNKVKFEKIFNKKTEKYETIKSIEEQIDIVIPKKESSNYRGKIYEVSMSPTNIILDENVFELISPKTKTKNPEKIINYPNIIDNICHKAVFDIENNLIIKKSDNMIFQENKNKKKSELLDKSKNDPDYIFEKEEAKTKYKKIFDDIEKAINIEELNSITI